MIVTVPACKIFIVEPDIEAMDVLELSYEKAPVVLFDDGGVNVNVPPGE